MRACQMKQNSVCSLIEIGNRRDRQISLQKEFQSFGSVVETSFSQVAIHLFL